MLVDRMGRLSRRCLGDSPRSGQSRQLDASTMPGWSHGIERDATPSPMGDENGYCVRRPSFTISQAGKGALNDHRSCEYEISHGRDSIRSC